MPLSDHDKTLVEAMFRDDCDVNTVLKVVPHAAWSTLYWMQRNFKAAGHVQKPSTAIKQRGRRRKLTLIVRQYAIELLAHRNDLWQEELAFKLWCEFDVEVSKSTICRMLKEERLSSKVNTRITSRRSAIEQGVYEETLAQLMARSHEANIKASEMLLYLNESAASKKVMFRRRSWSAISLPTYTRSELLSKVRCSMLPALDIHRYLPRATLIVKGVVT
jgi:transposase